ncbi:hypothetical protein HU675_0038125 [Bradyrhizobium septentrionale]|uniref:hypothetical protein n=1 Tax=Bradyrhizobium septentrionale TaxID=1404411 RepID=UPI001596B7ED|nr:hypothetical protein [Bradyrhizobium septentrionale]UGY23704.1 hypothetical protein HU675_0038125 [Bradyrhizobium septentrionale]
MTTAPTQYSSLAGLPTLGTAAAEDVGAQPGNVVQLDNSGKLPAVDGSALLNINVGPQPVHCGRLIAPNTFTVQLIPYRGNALQINGKLYTIPANGVLAIVPSGLTQGCYYIYAFVNGTGAIALEFSQSGHTSSAAPGNLGIEVKVADESRSLVGMVFLLNGNTIFDTPTQRFCASWFNQRPRPLLKLTGGQYTTTTASFTEMGGGAERVQFITWAGTAVQLGFSQTIDLADNGTTASTSWLELWIDGSNNSGLETWGQNGAFSGTIGQMFTTISQQIATDLSELVLHHAEIAWMSATAGFTTTNTGSGNGQIWGVVMQ